MHLPNFIFITTRLVSTVPFCDSFVPVYNLYLFSNLFPGLYFIKGMLSIELTNLKGRDKITVKTDSLLTFDE